MTDYNLPPVVDDTDVRMSSPSAKLDGITVSVSRLDTIKSQAGIPEEDGPAINVSASQNLKQIQEEEVKSTTSSKKVRPKSASTIQTRKGRTNSTTKGSAAKKQAAPTKSKLTKNEDIVVEDAKSAAASETGTPHT